MKKIVFVCTGNTCRSPMAEALLKHHGGERFLVKSAGVYAAEGMEASEYAEQAIQEQGIAMDHSSQRISQELVQWADFVLTMTEQHKETLASLYPKERERVFTLKEFLAEDVPGKEKDEAELRAAYAEIELQRALYGFKWQRADDTEKEQIQQQFLQAIAPYEAKISELEGQQGSFDVIDPFGQGLAYYRETRNELEQLILKLMNKL
ncbi:protein tyrosine phosphatase [Fictibacillus macauensis ZFHKF-1]|uniref:Protein tyrosine phosphatase n=1 Tax=Fictibacillus macauensis ZFHKF-1 TaxID=1196324 RepID=I8IWG7_9BACL|nr:low molecular weight protein arginine phosphatase [Fictibacillus macauensis]EIT83841.1 protein tyrosine phosphatase [Fictibacillus macauensis ZFHKF-1]